jgi:hypothetical protein
VGPSLGAAVPALTAVAGLVVRRAGLTSWSVVPRAVLRAALHLALVSALIASIAGIGGHLTRPAGGLRWASTAVTATRASGGG